MAGPQLTVVGRRRVHDEGMPLREWICRCCGPEDADRKVLEVQVPPRSLSSGHRTEHTPHTLPARLGMHEGLGGMMTIQHLYSEGQPWFATPRTVGHPFPAPSGLSQ